MPTQIKGKLYLLPSPIADDNLLSIPEESLAIISTIKKIVCERARTSRRAIKALIPLIDINSIEIMEGGHNFGNAVVEKAIRWLKEGHDVGLMSEAGSPAIADPGAELVFEAHKQSIEVIPLVGPNSILMALMASGLGGQEFCFHGYMPHKKDLLEQKLKSLANDKSLKDFTHICIEAPYRHRFLFDYLKLHLPSRSILCIASGIQSKVERIRTKKIEEWEANEIDSIHKIPSIFLFKLS